MNYIFNLINLVFKINRYIFEIYTKNKNKVEINGQLGYVIKGTRE